MKTRKLLSLLLMMLIVGALSINAWANGTYVNPLSLDNMELTFGDTSNPTWPESNMYFTQESGNTYQAVYSTNGTTEDTSYYPDILSMYILPVGNNPISSIVGTDVTFVTYDSITGEPTYSSTTTVNNDGFYAIRPQSANSQIVVTPESGSSDAVTVKFKTPVAQTASGGTTPNAVCGYLPVGQFATGAGWGAICTNGSNTGTTRKFVSGYVSTGFSLGMLGGYVQFDLGNNTYITDDPNNPYGIDFIVYGNPFSGNPEAGSVMVSEDGAVWYNLAGSLHYDSNTQQNVNISYMKIDTAKTINNTSFAKGIYYSTNYVPTSSTDSTTVNNAITAATWTSFVTGTNWWPEYSTESYSGVWNDGHVGNISDSYTTGDVYWNRSGAGEVITYMGVTRVKDDAEMSLSGADATNYYRFGYADVRQAGSSYGTAINPYASLPASSAGGDGFDLSWAVDTNGNPVDMSSKHIRFIRFYSAVLYNAGVFGETSTEVCGIYVASGTGSGAPTTTTNSLYISDGPTTIGANPSGAVQVAAGSYKIQSNATYLYVNGAAFTSGNTVSVSAGHPVQIISQTGTESPRVVVLYVN